MSAYSDAVLADTPALYWRLGESSGTAAEDATANNRDGTYIDTPTLAQAGALAGDADTSVDFNGVSEYVDSGYNPFTNSTIRTFEGWAWRDATAGVDELFGSAAASNNVSLRMDTAGAPIRFYSSTAGADANWPTGGWFVVAQWFYWVLIFDETANTAELFINGLSQGIKALTVAYNATPGNFRLALGSASASQGWDGKLDEVAIYESALSFARIRAHYLAGVGAGADPSDWTSRYSQLVLAGTPSLYWSMGSGGLTDLSGNGRDGTAVGGLVAGTAGGGIVGSPDRATNFDGVNDYVDSSYSPFTNSTTRTFEGWAYRNNTTNVDEFFGSAASGNNVSLRMDTAGQPIRFYASTAGSDANWTTSNWFVVTRWFHWVLIFNETADTAELFINGASHGSKAIATAYNAAPGAFRLGLSSASFLTQGWDGRLDEVAVYESALTAATIAEHYRVGAEALSGNVMAAGF